MTGGFPPSRPAGIEDRYLLLLCCALLGYALLGKGFAYFGYRPMFVGEIAFVAGVVVLLRTGCLIALCASAPCLLLATMMGWTLSRTLPYLGVYGFDALRDSVIILYGVFAFVVAALLLDDYSRINTIIRYYRRFLDIYVPAAPILFPLSFYFQDYMPNIPGTTVSLLWIGAGEVAVHLAGATVFTLAGFRRATPIWTICLVAALVMVSAVSRAAMLAFIIPVAVAAIVLGKAGRLIAIGAAGLALLAVTFMLESSLSNLQEARVSTERRVSSAQVIENVASIIGQGGAQTEDTKEWREKWWRIIIANTVHGPYFWTGRGFGANLGVEDGFASPRSERPLRSPHNGHMTILARAGVPGLVLWGIFLATWFGGLARTILRSFRRGPREWVGFLLFIGCYVLACVINASFDVALEAPMQGIWFWCLIGFGIGATMIYRYLQSNEPWKPSTARKLMRAGMRDTSLPA